MIGKGLADLNKFDCAVFVHFRDMAFWFREEVRGEEAKDGRGGDDIEEGRSIDEGVDREEGDCSHIAVGSCHPGDLSSHPALNEGDHGEDCAFSSLDKEGTAHGGKNGEGDGPTRADLTEGEVANGEAG